MKISKDLARELLDLDKGDSTTGWEDGWFCGGPRVEFELVHSKLIDTTRWSHIHERVYKDLTTGKFWITDYSVGATECQDQAPYEYDGDEIEFQEVVPVEIKKTIYKAVK